MIVVSKSQGILINKDANQIQFMTKVISVLVINIQKNAKLVNKHYKQNSWCVRINYIHS